MRDDFRLGDWLVQPSLARISKPGYRGQVRAKVMDLLVYFARHPGEVIAKDVLLRDVWGTESISESALMRTITELRQALGDEVAEPSILETIPKRGYRLVAPVVVDASIRAPDGRKKRVSLRDKARSPTWLWPLASIGTVVMAAAAWIALRSSPAEHAPMRSRPVTTLEGVESDPTLPPDGSQIAFIWNGALHVKTVNSGGPRRIADNVFGAAWSPDGQWIATYRQTGEPGHHNLLLISPSGGHERMIRSLHTITLKSMDWSPDGEWVAVTHKEHKDVPPAVFVISTKTGEFRRVNAGDTPANDPHFSNDGQRLAFFRDLNLAGEGRFEVLTVGVDGKDATTVGTFAGLPLGLDWSPDDRALILSMRTAENVGGLWRVPLDTGVAQPLEVGENAWRFSISGRRLTYAQHSANSQLWLSPGPESSVNEPPRLFLEQGRNDSLPRFSPDGQRVVHVSTRTGVPQLWVCKSDGTACFQLTHDGICTAPAWSPDGKWIAFINGEGSNDVYIVDANGGVLHALTRDPAPDGVPGFSRDGRWVYFSSKRDELCQRGLYSV